MALVAYLAQQYHAPLLGAIIAYNFFAFFMQLPLGIIADQLNKNAVIAALGCFLVTLALAGRAYAFYACVIAGLGNALFHVGGALDVLAVSHKRAAPVGIFVSTGALGLFFGTAMLHWLPMVAALLLFSAGLLLCLYVHIRGKVTNLSMQLPIFDTGKLAVAVCLILTVCLRSYVGSAAVFAWKIHYWLALLAVGAVVLGKMLGGIMGDRVGFVRTAAHSLAVAAVAFLFAFNYPIAGIIALLCFNMTMPLTLTALVRLMPHNKGFAFGILTAALFVGAVAAFWKIQPFSSPVGLCFLSLLSAGLLIPALQRGEKYDR